MWVDVGCRPNQNHETFINVAIGTPTGTVEHQVDYDKRGRFVQKLY